MDEETIRMNPYTVILLIEADLGAEALVREVRAPDPDAAFAAAREEAREQGLEIGGREVEYHEWDRATRVSVLSGHGLAADPAEAAPARSAPDPLDPGAPDWIELRPAEDGSFDEIVARFADGIVHVETTDDTSVYIDFSKPGDGPTSSGLQLWISSRGRLRYCHAGMGPAPTAPRP